MAAWDVAVVGLGAMGSAALYHLARRGVRTIGLEQFEPGHTIGSSHGESRLIRLAYFEHPSYVPLVRSAYAHWLQLEARTGRQVLITTGILEAGPQSSALVAGSLRSCIEHDIPYEALSGRAAAQRFPAFRLPDGWTGIYQPDAGMLLPELAIALQLEAARELGAEARFQTRVAEIRPSADAVRLILEDGASVEAGAVVLAAGPWIGRLAPFLEPQLRLTRQILAWFRPARPGLVGPGRMPAFIFDAPEDVIYGMPDLGHGEVKAASHLSGGDIDDPDDPRPAPDISEVGVLADALAAYAPAAAGPISRLAACLYTRAPDDDFILGLHPDWPNLILASPCSGHGFKFSSVIGEILADLALTGETAHDINRFRPDRFG